MDTLILKAFLPETFFSLALLFQLIVNTKNVNNLKYNFPLIENEVIYQNLFIFFGLILFLNDLKIEGYLGTYLLITNSTIVLIKQTFIIICMFALIVIHQSHIFQKINFTEFYSLFFLSVLGLLLMISTSDLLLFYLVMEAQALCFYVIGGSNRSSLFSIEAGLKYFISGSFISGLYLLGTSFIYLTVGTINLNDISLLLTFNLSTYNPEMFIFFSIGVILVLVTLLFKLACAPFHFWSPDVYDGAPLYGTILFSIVPKIPLYFFLIKFLDALNQLNNVLSPVLLYCGIASIVVGTFFALSQNRLKRLIVYSSVAQTGFLVASISTMSLTGYTNSIFFLILYMVTSLLIWGHFVIFYLFSFKTNSFFDKESSSLFLPTMNNLFKYNPLWAFFFVVIFFSIGGIPPLTGFLSKMLVVFSLIVDNYLFESILIVVVSSISVYYYIRLLKVIFFEPIKKIKLEEFKVNYSENELNILLNLLIILILFLLIMFYFPTDILLLSQLISLTMF
jgi:proton-translocating NADH-quinone oxidoreductase chain N